MYKEIIIIDGGVERAVQVEADRHDAFDSIIGHLAPGLRAGQGIQSVGDAGEAMAFLVSQLAYTESQLFERMYQPMQYEQFIPIDYSAGEWADTIRYEIYDWAGRGKRISGKGKDLPLVDVAFADKQFAVCQGGIGYEYTTEELRRSAFLRRALPERRLAAAMEGYRRHMNIVGLYGEATSNLTGLFNNALVPTGNAPTGTWATATPDQILNDVNTLIQNVWTNTAYNDMITDIILPPLSMAKVSSTARSTTSDKTILAYVKENNVAKQERGVDINFTTGFGLNTAGAGSTRRMMGYVKRPERLVMHIPLPLRFLAPQPVGLSVQVPGEYKYSGVEIRYPSSAYYMDGL
jgi:hypothetical protein